MLCINWFYGMQIKIFTQVYIVLVLKRIIVCYMSADWLDYIDLIYACTFICEEAI